MENPIVENIVLSKKLINKIKEAAQEQINIMEVCGTHTMSIYKYGIDKLLKGKINFLSGPGCPVCVTSTAYIDEAIELLNNDKVMLVTFADMLRVPGSKSSLAIERSKGKKIKIIYTPLDLIKIAEDNKKMEVVFLAVGFETIAPIYADVIIKAYEKGISNLSFILSVKRMPNIMAELLEDKEIKVQGLLCPGHVAAITGTKDFENLAIKYNIPMIVSGFNSVEILSSVYKLVEMIKEKDYRCLNYYESIVKRDGNKTALLKIAEVFENNASYWRGMGRIADTGFTLKEKYKQFDAAIKFNLTIDEHEKSNGCLCGNIIKGKNSPTDCRYFGKVCTPTNPLGPCMVSQEGTCSNYYKYH